MTTERIAEHLLIDAENMSSELIDRAGSALRDGKLVAIPTETVYGLGCNALDPKAVRSVFAAKDRPFSDPLIVHVDGAEMIEMVIDGPVPSVARILMDRFWPGPLTIVLPRGAAVPDEISGGLDTVAVRVPSHPVAAAIITAAGVPVAAPSANKFGHVSPTSAEHVFSDLGRDCDVIVDSGRTERGLESTVVSIDGDGVVVLRHGAVTMESIAQALGDSGSVSEPQGSGGSTASPGHADRHYSPNAETVAVSHGLMASFDENLREQLARQNVLYAGYVGSAPSLPSGWVFKSLGSRDDLAGIGHDLYESLRAIDSDDVALIVLELTGAHDLGRAIDDRMSRAASSVVAESFEELLSSIPGPAIDSKAESDSD